MDSGRKASLFTLSPGIFLKGSPRSRGKGYLNRHARSDICDGNGRQGEKKRRNDERPHLGYLQGPIRLPFIELFIVIVCPAAFTVFSTTPSIVEPV